MARRLVETLRGIGTIEASGHLLRRTAYEVSVWSDDRPLAPGEPLDARTSIDGHIDITGIGEAVVLVGPGTLILTIEDGRRLLIQVTSTGGSIAGRGWLPSA
jgi:hypothetical protein